MGHEGLLAKATQQESAAYRVIAMRGSDVRGELRNLVLSRWKRSLRYGNDYFRLVDPSAFYDAYNVYLDRLLSAAQTTVRVAVLAEDGDVVLGFSVSRGPVLDYVHVHKDQRRCAIARSLVPSNIHTITHVTKTGLTIWASKYPQWKFNPFA